MITLFSRFFFTNKEIIEEIHKGTVIHMGSVKPLRGGGERGRQNFQIPILKCAVDTS